MNRLIEVLCWGFFVYVICLFVVCYFGFGIGYVFAESYAFTNFNVSLSSIMSISIILFIFVASVYVICKQGEIKGGL